MEADQNAINKLQNRNSEAAHTFIRECSILYRSSVSHFLQYRLYLESSWRPTIWDHPLSTNSLRRGSPQAFFQPDHVQVQLLLP